MKFIDKFMTEEEQKAIFFILIAGVVGLMASFISIQTKHSKIQIEADSERVELAEPLQITYNINTVTIQELMTVGGLGRHRAELIIAYRDANRPIEIDELLNIKGVGVKTVEQIKESFDLNTPLASEKSTSVTIKETSRMNINEAELVDLTKISGIGETRGLTILSFAKEQGRIKKIDQLLEVKGVGQKTLINIKEQFYGDED